LPAKFDIQNLKRLSYRQPFGAAFPYLLLT
jgi:hypothetical protein